MADISRSDLLAFMRQQQYAVQASVSASGTPQAAVVGIVVSDRLEVFFDTLASSRKAVNLRHNSAIALTIGSLDDGAQRSVQLEGIADEPLGAELDRLLALYFETFPDGRERQAWPGITYFRVKPTWLRYSNYAADPPQIVELSAADLPQP
jgi:general stress protein 26